MRNKNSIQIFNDNKLQIYEKIIITIGHFSKKPDKK